MNWRQNQNMTSSSPTMSATNATIEPPSPEFSGLEWFPWMTEGLLLLVVGAVGLVGNCCSIVIFARQRIQRVFHHLLLMLATFDALYIICSILLFALPMFIDDYTDNVKLYLLPYVLPVIHVALVGSIYSTVSLAIERYITVCHPFTRYRSSYKSKFFLLPVIAFSFLYTLPKFFELRLIKVPVGNATSNETALTFDGDLEELEFETVLDPTALRKSKLYVRIYLIWVNLFVQIVIPFVSLVLLNYRTYKTILKSERELRTHLQGQQALATTNTSGTTAANPFLPQRSNCSENKASSLRRREVILSRISIYIAFVFLFCHSVRIVPNAYELVTTYTKPEDDEDDLVSFPKWVLRFVNLSHLFITFACSASFYIYYRKLGTLCSCRTTQRNNNASEAQRTEGTNGGDLDVAENKPLKTFRDQHRTLSTRKCPITNKGTQHVTKGSDATNSSGASSGATGVNVRVVVEMANDRIK